MGFEVVSSDVTIAPAQEATYSFYFHTPNDALLGIDEWISDLSPGIVDAVLYFNPSGNGSHPDGIDLNDSCPSGTQNATWTYATQLAHQDKVLPSDDGTGTPLAQIIPRSSAGCLRLHHLNTTAQPLTAHADIKANALPTGTRYTQTDMYVTYQYNIAIPPGATGVTATASCPLPTGVKFWSLSTYSHKQSVHTDVKDGATAVFQSTDWQNPGAQEWTTAPFYTFGTPNLTWECTYDNNAPPPFCDQTTTFASCSNADTTVVQGASSRTNEMCIALGYFFPSTGPRFEVVDNGSCLSF